MRDAIPLARPGPTESHPPGRPARAWHCPVRRCAGAGGRSRGLTRPPDARGGTSSFKGARLLACIQRDGTYKGRLGVPEGCGQPRLCIWAWWWCDSALALACRFARAVASPGRGARDWRGPGRAVPEAF